MYVCMYVCMYVNNPCFESRDGYACVTKRVQKPYGILLYCLQQYKGYTLNSAYHNVVVEKGCAGNEDDAQKTGILSAKLPPSCSLHELLCAILLYIENMACRIECIRSDTELPCGR